MAFAKQYFSSYKSNNNLDYYLEIWVDGFDSSATEISVGAGGPVISYETDQEDRFSPIISSQCVLPFVVKDISTQAFIQQLRTTYKERQVYLHLYRATSSTYTTTKPIWSGFLVMDLGSGEDVFFPYEQKLTFVDGLSLLKDIDFVDLSNAGSETNIQGSYTQDNMYYGPGLYTFWIKEILAKAGVATTTKGVSIDYGFTTAVNWYNADMQNTNQGSDPLGLTKCVVSMFHTKNDQDVFTPENCYTVLKELLRHWGARITYWKHEFWIVQIPEYITDENGLIDNPDNINSRQYNRFGTLTGSQDHLGDTYYTRYEQTIQSNQVSKLVGTKYNYLPMIHNADADFLSFSSKNYYGGFPYGANAESQEIFQGTIIDPSTADFLWLSIPLDWKWDMSGSSLTNGHIKGWWCSVKFNFYASDGTTTYYLQYDSSNQGSYYWVDSANWTPLGNESPKYIIKSNSLTETNYVGFKEDIPFVDDSGSAITMTGAWSFFLDIEDFANQSSSGVSPGSFFCRFSGYAPSSHYSYVKHDPYQEFPKLPTTGNVSGSGPETKSGKVSWSNTLENPATVFTSVNLNPAGFNAGTSQADIQLMTSSDFKGLLQTLNTTQSASFGSSINTQVNNSTNTERFSFGTLLWGDAIDQFAVSCLRVNNGTAFEKTNPIGEWGRGTLTGTNTFTELLINEFLSGQIKVVITPTMRLAVGEANKDQTATGTGGPATRPRYVNPIGRLRESRTNETDPEYIFRRGSFYSLYDEWDYEGYQILRETVSATTTTNDIGGLGGAQDNGPISDAKIIPNVTNALMMNSPVAYIRTTVPATGSNVAVNGNFNTAVGWTLGTGWSIDTTAKKAKFAATGSTSELTQSVLTQGLTYQVNFQVVVTAGTLLVKAGTSGTSQSITTSGDYSFYLDCDGSNLIKFQAGTTFTGNITYITLRDQKSISAVPINSIGSTVFKSGDTFNLINSLGGEILPLTVSSNQGATDDTISVTSTALFDDIGIDSVLLINQDDLSAQYQNKTKGTVAGFGIDADGISKGGIEITGWLNSDTMSGADVTNVPTALSVKNYVDAQVGSADTLQEVTDNGNTTTNSITIGNAASPNNALEVYGNADSGVARFRHTSNGAYGSILLGSVNRLIGDVGNYIFKNGSSELMRLTSGGNLLLGTTTGSEKLVVAGNIQVNGLNDSADGLHLKDRTFVAFSDSGSVVSRFRSEATGSFQFQDGSYNTGINLKTNATSTFSGGGLTISGGTLTGTTATFSGQVTIPATPVASTDAASKSYVDAQVGSADTLQEVTDNGNTTTNSIMIGSSSSPTRPLHVYGSGELGRFESTSTTTTISLRHTAGYYSTIKSVNGKLSFNADDGNTGANTNISFHTDGSERMRLTDTGLGIGTSSPSDKLQVQDGYIRVAYTGGAAFKLVPHSSNDGYGFYDAVNLNFDMWFDGGNVGIGNVSPLAKMHITAGSSGVSSVDTGTSAIIESNTTNYLRFVNPDASTGGLVWTSPSDNFGAFLRWGHSSGLLEIATANSNDSITFATGNASEKMRLTSGGRLGINTSTPQTFLDVNLGGATNQYASIGGTISPGEYTGIHFGYLETGNSSYRKSMIVFERTDLTESNAQGKIHILNGPQIGGTSATIADAKLTISETGNVGINQQNPTEKLHVVGDALITGDSHADAFKPAATGEPIKFKNFGSTELARITDGGQFLVGTTTDDGSNKLQVAGNIKIKSTTAAQLFLDSASNVDAVLNFQENNVQKAKIGYDSSNSGLALVTGSGPFSTAAMVVLDNGNVGIGTSTPQSGFKLDVNGTSVTRGDIYLLNSINHFGTGDFNISASGSNTIFKMSGSEKMRLTSGGNLLIGTTTDSGKKLQINSDTTYDGIQITGANIPTLGIIDTTNNVKLVVYTRDNDATIGTETNHVFTFQTNAVERARFSTAGNVLIGTTSDSGHKLQVNGDIQIGDNDMLRLGDSSDLKLYHTGTGTVIQNAVGNLTIQQDQNSGDIVFRCDDGIGGTAIYFALDGGLGYTRFYKDIRFEDSKQALFGTGSDLKIQHNGTDSFITNNGGDLNIIQYTNSKDVILECDNGTGGTTPYITLDGSQTTINLQQSVLIGTTTNSGVYKLDVFGKARVQSVFELDDVLTLNQISTPADPASGKSSIYMDSADGAIKCKINVGGTVVTRTIASFE